MSFCDNEQFALWAFGNEWSKFLADSCREPLILLEAWNKKHGDKLVLSHAGNIRTDMEMMEKLWEIRNDKD
jgi:hypothetical protein